MGSWPKGGGGEEGLPFKSDGEKSSGDEVDGDMDVHRKIQIKSLRRLMWVWLKFKLTPKGDFCVVNVRACFVNLFMYSTNRYLNGQTYNSDAPSQTHKSETKISKNLHPKAIRRASPSLFYWSPPEVPGWSPYETLTTTSFCLPSGSEYKLLISASKIVSKQCPFKCLFL